MTETPTKTTMQTSLKKALPAKVKVAELEQYHGHALRTLADNVDLGTPNWRSTASKDELIKKLRDDYPVATIENPGPRVERVQETQETPVVSSAVIGRPGLYVPNADPTFVIDTGMRSYLSSLRQMQLAGKHPKHTLLTGPQGCGKTTIPYQFSAIQKMPILKMNCANVREPRDWFGSKQASDGQVFWKKSLFARAIAEGNVVILLDEITRVAPPVNNALMSLLDATREVYIEEADELLVMGENVFVFGTANVGAAFSGTFKLDVALKDRFGGIIECTYLPPEAEVNLLVTRSGVPKEVAEKLVRIAGQVRAENTTTGKITETISTRNLLDVADLWSYMNVNAVRFALLPHFDNDGGATSERAQVVGFVIGQFPSFTL